MLDTNTCIFAINNNAAVRTRFIAEYPLGLSISAITEAELWFGIENSAAPEKNAETLRSFLATVEILPFDTIAAAEYGHIRTKLKRAGTPIGDRDTFIASHAKALGLTLVTNNTREFKHVEGLALEDWLV
ncbi:MAG: type II toxin-antitoxin system VapC family toxin [Clostridiales bacterium]|jgi:tRNA(fMet)-specific endonuclease VapC|nr:type II toxin-antitoxin system VapC family toxin [Clostridiales bacterium]